MRLISKQVNRWLLPTVLILFILEIILLPFVLGITYSGRSESPNHVLTYTYGKLTWDSETVVGENGVAEMDLFDREYNNVLSENEDNLVAPGTERTAIIRLNNTVDSPIKYTALAYSMRSRDILPVEVSMTGEGFTDTENYTPPQGISRDQVFRAVEGTVEGGEIQDFDINWFWTFFVSDEQDVVDTSLGDKAAFFEADDITVGFYIIIEGDEGPIMPGAPPTGDNSHVGMYIALMFISAVLLVILFFGRKKEKEESEECEE